MAAKRTDQRQQRKQQQQQQQVSGVKGQMMIGGSMWLLAQHMHGSQGCTHTLCSRHCKLALKHSHYLHQQ